MGAEQTRLLDCGLADSNPDLTTPDEQSQALSETEKGPAQCSVSKHSGTLPTESPRAQAGALLGTCERGRPE